MSSRLLIVAALGGLLCASTAFGQIRPMSIEGSVYGGVWEGDATFDTAATLGGRLGLNLHRIFGIEANYGAVPTTQFERPNSGIGTTKDVLLSQIGVNAILHLSYDRFVPFVTAGGGFVIADETDVAANVGLGAKYYFNEMIGLRADLRSWLSPDAPATDTFAHFEATLGVTVMFGGDKDMDGDGIANIDDQCPGAPEDKDQFEDQDGCPDTDNDGDEILDADDKCPNDAEDMDGEDDEDGCPDVDADGDGIGDRDDKCPNDPEDKDGFADEDGCPDPDNDQDGVLDGADKCATDAEDKDGFEDEDGCPDTDNDKDGLLDAADKCPDGAEDKDGFEDEDGCPDPDNDQDGVLDADDQCPNEKETINGNKDDDGCPDKGKSLVAVGATRIEIKQTVYFDTGKATIQKRSFNLLNQVALILKANSQIAQVQVEGHTDDRGNDDFNMKLSQDRAASVKAYLVERGLAADRLVAKGFGETRPIESNRSRKGREKNRRVEFNIVEPAPAGDAAPAKTKVKEKVKAPVKKPDAPVKKPDAPVKKPDAPVKKPDAPVKKPDAPVKKPDAPVKKPDAPVKKPDAPQKKPDGQK